MELQLPKMVENNFNENWGTGMRTASLLQSAAQDTAPEVYSCPARHTHLGAMPMRG